ncbi:hypothetical protein [Moraxella cuniculi]|uniref:Uncharacterized protein n=1 Tax=Moraxella cuniculi TaxID=34061 RepID=A0A3S4SZI5_9GAMM|nr:hypothetical protein [Moraxella cuniculi]VEG13379.1 Uncharacterised protein [Moraxella cuniculi]
MQNATLQKHINAKVFLTLLLYRPSYSRMILRGIYKTFLCMAIYTWSVLVFIHDNLVCYGIIKVLDFDLINKRKTAVANIQYGENTLVGGYGDTLCNHGLI